MDKPLSHRVDLASRLSARGVIAGAIISAAVLSLVMLLGGALRIWSFTPGVGMSSRAGFGIWFLVSWVIGTFVGAYAASLIARASGRADGLLHGLATWATSWLLVRFASMMGMLELRLSMGASRTGLLWAAFLIDAAALCAGLLGGISGARAEAKAEEAEPKAYVQHEPTPRTT
jgi:hypothetical protein